MSEYHTDTNNTNQDSIRLPSSQAEHHSFNILFAELYGVHEAILIAHFQHWINHNMRLGRNSKDGRTWTYQTRKEIAAWFPYFNEDQVRRLTDKLVEKEVLVKGNYNKSRFDKTVWYAFKNEEIFTIGKSANSIDESANSIDESATPIPDTKPDTETDKNNNPAEPEAPSAVVVPSSLHELSISDSLKQKIAKEYSVIEIDIAVRRALKWKSRSSDEVGVMTALSKPDDWVDNPEPEDIEANNRQFKQSLAKIDGKEFGFTRVSIGNSYVEFVCGMKVDVYKVEDKHFILDVKKHLERIQNGI